MNITVRQGEIQKQRAGALVVNLFQGARPGGATLAVDRALGGLIGAVLDSGDFKGKQGETLLLYTQGRVPAPRLLLVGLGPQEKFGLEAARAAAGSAAGKLDELGVPEAATILHGTGAGGLEVEPAAEALAEASILAGYRFETYRSSGGRARLEKLRIVEFQGDRVAAARRGVRSGQALAQAVCLARDLVNTPPGEATPAHLARAARNLARARGLRCQVLQEAGMKKLGMHALLGVARGSAQTPRFIVLEHRGRRKAPPLVFVGKGVTFDSGGLSLKPASSMEKMKGDMAGAAAVLGALQAVADLDLPQPVVGLVPAVENMPDGRALRPGDVLRTMAGKTIEVLNTDAEGRLILADALWYAGRFRPAAIVDLATLTGACVTALGQHAAGLFASDEALGERIRRTGAATGERVWPLPLWPEYRQQIDSAVADMKNTGGRDGGACTAAALLAEFAGPHPWAHLDIAGTAWGEGARGGTGYGVRLLAELARTWKEPS